MKTRMSMFGAARRALPSTLLFMACMLPSARAQTSFEYSYGNTCGDHGTRGAAPVLHCPSGGFVATGFTRSAGCGNSNVYVVRTNPNGSYIWAYGYDIDGLGMNDYGTAVHELSDGTGFVVVGMTEREVFNGNPPIHFDAFMMKIDCNGGVVWTKTYGSNSTHDEADDVIELPAAAGGAADLMFAGFSGLGTARDAWLVRTSSTGVPIWGNIYNGGGDERLYSLIRTTQAPNAGDIVAVGSWQMPGSPLGMQGFMMRVDATTGAIGAAPQGAADFGGAGSERFNSVIELNDVNERGKLVAIGTTTSFDGSLDIYMVKNLADPCTLQQPVQSAIGHAPDRYGVKTQDVGTDVRELTQNYNSYNPALVPGYLAITGYTDTRTVVPPYAPDSLAHQYDVLLQAIDPVSLFPLAKTNFQLNEFLFGGNGIGLDDVGNSIAEVTPAAGNAKGFLIGGAEANNFKGSTPPDPENLYLIKTNASGQTGCQYSAVPVARVLAEIKYCDGLMIDEYAPNFQVTNVRTEIPSNILHCAPPSPKINLGGNGAEAPAAPSTIGAIRTYPNPVERGGSVTLAIAPAAAASYTVTIFDAAGRSLRSWPVTLGEGDGEIAVGTEGLASGVYMITISDGRSSESTRIVVTERH